MGYQSFNGLEGALGALLLDASEGAQDKVHCLSLIDAILVLLEESVELGEHVLSHLLGLSVTLEGILNHKESFQQDTHISGLRTTILHLLKNI